MHARISFLPAVVLAALLAGAGCAPGSGVSTLSLSPPAGATPYALDDASTDRVALAFADLHAALRTLGDGRWTPVYYRVAAGRDWNVLRDELDQQAQAAGWQAHSSLSAQGTGYARQAWTDGTRVVAAALVRPPAGSEGATVLIVLTPRG